VWFLHLSLSLSPSERKRGRGGGESGVGVRGPRWFLLALPLLGLMNLANVEHEDRGRDTSEAGFNIARFRFGSDDLRRTRESRISLRKKRVVVRGGCTCDGSVGNTLRSPCEENFDHPSEAMELIRLTFAHERSGFPILMIKRQA